MTVADDRLARLTPEKAALYKALLAEERAASVPADATEAALCAIWSEAFARPVTPTDDFFLLGGDSILALRLAARAQAAGFALRGPQVFAHPTIRSLATHVRSLSPPGLSPSAARPTEPTAVIEVPLTPMQQGVLYQTQAAERGEAYVSQFVCTFPRSLDLGRMAAAWKAVARRRAALRTAVTYGEDGRPALRIVPDAAPDIVVHDWRNWDADAAARALETYAVAERARGFDLARAPLMRLAFIRKPDGTVACVWTHHHLVLDGWSQLVLLEDVFAAYRDATVPEGDDVDAVVAFAAAQPERLTTSAAAFWRGAVGSGAPCSFARDSAAAADAPVETASGDLGTALCEELARAAAAAKTTPGAAAELVWAVVLAGLFGREDPVFGLVAAVRPATPEAERLAWLCINTVPLRSTLLPHEGFAEALAGRTAARLALQERLPDPLSEVLKTCPDAGFGSLLVIESFHAGAETAARALDPVLAPRDVRFRVREHHPLVCVISGPPDKLGVEIKIDRRWHVPISAAALCRRVLASAERMAAEPQRPLPEIARDIAEAVAAEVRDAAWSKLAEGRVRRG